MIDDRTPRTPATGRLCAPAGGDVRRPDATRRPARARGPVPGRSRPSVATRVQGLALALALSACVAAGCGSVAAPGAAAPGTTAQGDAVALPVPFAGLLAITSENQRALHDAEERAVASCMKDRGFTYTPLPFTPPNPDRQPVGDLAAAREHGYGIADGSAQTDHAVPENDPANQTDVAGLAPAEREAFQRALGGTVAGPEAAKDPTQADPSRTATVSVPGGPVVSFDPDSCFSLGRKAVYGDDARWTLLQGSVVQLQNEVYDRVLFKGTATGREYRAAIERWRACMRGRGFDEERPYAAAEVLAQQATSGGVDRAAFREREVQLAVADAECFRDEGLLPVMSAEMDAVEREVTAANQGVIVEFQELQHRAIDRARSGAAVGGR